MKIKNKKLAALVSGGAAAYLFRDELKIGAVVAKHVVVTVKTLGALDVEYQAWYRKNKDKLSREEMLRKTAEHVEFVAYVKNVRMNQMFDAVKAAKR